MFVRFVKNPPAAASDLLVCVRADGSLQQQDLPRETVLPRLAVALVVEQTLHWNGAVFGQIAGGKSFAALLSPPGRSSTAPESARLGQSLALAEVLQAEQWQGAADDKRFTAALAKACRTRRVPAPEISPPDLLMLRAALRSFGAAWRPLAPGGVLERTFGA